MNVKKSRKTDLRKESRIFLSVGVVGALALSMLISNISKAGTGFSLPVLDAQQVVEVCPSIENSKPEKPEGENDIHDYVKHMPQFKDGDKALAKWISTQTRYPLSSDINDMRGRVTVQFVVEKNGSLSNFEVVQSPDEKLSQEAMRIMESSPEWIPGKQNGKPVRVRYAVLINFKTLIDPPKAAVQNSIANCPEADMSYDSLDEKPKFKYGKYEAVTKWIADKVKYPSEAIDYDVTGRVIASFIVEKDGSVSNITIIQNPNNDLSLEVVRVLKSCPKWTPGKLKGEPVRVRYTVPVDFNLRQYK